MTVKLHSDFRTALRNVSHSREIQTEMIGQMADIANNSLHLFLSGQSRYAVQEGRYCQPRSKRGH